MGVRFTEKQKKVIDTFNKNLLVSAAAGSGKTAVLTERIVNIISSKENPVDIDCLLVVTFTNAAAEEMKERVLDAIEKKCIEDPYNEHLIKQKTYIHSAQITTIHSFCLNLIKENFNVLDIDPIFRIADEGELKLLMSDIVSGLLNDYYENADVAFIDFIEAYADSKNDENIENLILELYKFSRSHPWPESWFDSCLEFYNVQKANIRNSIWMKELNKYIDDILEENLLQIKKALDISLQAGGPYVYEENLKSDMVYINRILQETDFDKRRLVLREEGFVRLSGKKDESIDSEMRERVKGIRSLVKKSIKDIKENYYYADWDMIAQDINNSARQVKVLVDLTREFSKRFFNAKREKNILDFNDLEHFALEILVKNDEDRILTTNVADEMADYFVEVMIDEYQDSNMLQEVILSAVSAGRLGRPNMICVGDVKQSIYKFRMARPELFMEKYERFSTQETGEDLRINLDLNFRSRKEVLSPINEIFKCCMHKSIGGIEYDEENCLYYGSDYPEAQPGQHKSAEIIIVEDVEKSGKEIEALAVAGRIKELISSGYEIRDKETGKMRPVKYSDIVILLRGLKGWSEIFEEVFRSEGIPSYAITSEGYFNAMEVRSVLSMLSIIDNPRQDIHLVAVLKSQMAGFNSNELAKIKGNQKKECFYEALESYSREAQDEILKQKVLVFLERLEKYRRMSEYLSIYEIISYVYSDTDYYNYVTAMPGGVKRKANLDLLLDKAINYEATSYNGLFNFVRYVEKLKKLEIDFSEASVAGEKDDVVRLMTIHKSKGLEFPVVFVSGMGKRFNMTDTTGKIILHTDLGIGADFMDPDERIKEPTLIKKAIANKIKIESLGEELRVLYVALTRAKEKLIITGNTKTPDKYFSTTAGEVGFQTILRAGNYLDWIIPSVIGSDVFEFKFLNAGDLIYSKMKSTIISEGDRSSLLNWDFEHTYNSEIKSEIYSRLKFRYPFEFETKLNTKISVSEIKKKNMKVDFEKAEETEDMVPEFIKPKEKILGSKRGDAYHKVFEVLNYETDTDEESIEHLIVKNDFGGIVKTSDVLDFLDSSIGRRMKIASANKRLFRECQYVMGVSASELDPNYSGEEIILIQGIIDAYFEEEDGLVIVDYKTDRVIREIELLDRYQSQLEYYKKALEQITGKKVKEMVIYSTGLGKEVVVK